MTCTQRGRPRAGENRHAVARAARTALVCLLPLVLGACPGDSHGISRKTPIGTFESLDAQLREKLPDRKDVAPITVSRRLGSIPEAAFIKGLPGVLYSDHAKQRAMVAEHVLVVHDGKGTVKAVQSWFHSGAKNFSTTGSKVDSFTARYWLAVAEGEPVFEKKHRSKRFTDEILEARAGNPNRGCLWRKVPMHGQIAHTRTLSDSVLFWAR